MANSVDVAFLPRSNGLRQPFCVSKFYGLSLNGNKVNICSKKLLNGFIIYTKCTSRPREVLQDISGIKDSYFYIQ